MIAAISIRGLGPHEDTNIRLAPRGRSTLSGQSEAGKTSTIDAVALAFWGTDRFGKPFDAASIRDGEQEVSVTVELANGAKIHRRLAVNAKGKIVVRTRRLTDRHGDVHTTTTDKDWISLLREKRFPAPTAMRLAMVPFAWLRLAQGPGDGRPLRDALSAILPAVDRRAIVRDLMVERDTQLREGDAISEDLAVEQRRKANAAVLRASGVVDGLNQVLQAGEATPVDGPIQTAVEAAGVLGMFVAAWDTYDAKADAWGQQEEQRARRVLAVEEWEERSGELGAKPPGDAAALEAAKTAEREATTAFDNARKARSAVDGEQARAIEERNNIRNRDLNGFPSAYSEDASAARRRVSDAVAALEQGDTCPTCGRDGWESRVADLKQEKKEADAAVVAAGAAIEEQRAAIVETKAAELVEVETRIEGLAKRFTHADGQVTATERALNTARDKLRSSESANVGAVDWDRAQRALGEKPEAPGEKEAEPTPPQGERPTADARKEAEETLRQATDAIARKNQRASDTERAEARLTAAESTLGSAQAEAARLGHLVDCVRAAPSVAVRRQLDALGDMSPVQLELPEGGGCIVRVDGRRWAQASDGRQVVADACFRAGIRRAMGAGYLSIFVDQVQNVGGQPAAPIKDPVILLRTTADRGLQVR